MLKRERLRNILEIVTDRRFVTIDELAKALQVSDMTIRRDLNELNTTGKVMRIHGGAQVISQQDSVEKNYMQKREINISEKKAAAKVASKIVQDGETIYVGPGTTLEFMVAKLNQKKLRVVTNSLPVFEAAKKNPNNYELILIGGSYRRVSGAFIGALANNQLRGISFDRGFVGVNGIKDTSMMTANLEEGQTQGLGLNRSRKKYVVADYHKINRNDFYEFYHLYDVDGLITSPGLDPDIVKHYSQITTLYQGSE